VRCACRVVRCDARFALARKAVRTGIGRPLGAGAVCRRRYESALAVAEGEFVMVQGRFSGGGRPTKIVVDILRVENGRLGEHWEVMQDEATRPDQRVGLRCSATDSQRRNG
jgi:hypothetical protein